MKLALFILACAVLVCGLTEGRSTMYKTKYGIGGFDTPTEELEDKIEGLRELLLEPIGRFDSRQGPCSIETCQDVKECGYTKDGHYWLSPAAIKHRRIKVYCHNLATSNPTEYITVNDATNYASDFGARDSPAMTVKFAKIRLHPKNMTIDTSDVAFATSSTGSFKGRYRPDLNYGMAASCVNRSPGSFKIDTTGTGIIIDTSSAWLRFGHYPVMSVARTSGGAIISGNCGGYCGWCKPESSTPPLKLNPDDVVSEKDVTTPECD